MAVVTVALAVLRGTRFLRRCIPAPTVIARRLTVVAKVFTWIVGRSLVTPTSTNKRSACHRRVTNRHYHNRDRNHFFHCSHLILNCLRQNQGSICLLISYSGL